MKKRLTSQQEFEIMKLVLDKFLLVGFAVMVFGMWQMYETGNIPMGLMWMVAGAILLLLFMLLIVKEYEVVK
jgi:hypothetical protein